MNDHPKKRWGCLPWGVVGVVVILLCMLLIPQPTVVSKVSAQMRAVSNAKQIIIAMKGYAAQYGSLYPGGHEQDANPRQTSNRMFRDLFVEGIVTDERIFGSMGSLFVPDGKIGEAPHFFEALQPGENHWMMLRDQFDTSFGNAPLITENALTTTWPPRWDVSANGASKPARAWKGGTIVMGRNDGSVQLYQLLPDGTLDVKSPEARGVKAWADYLSKEKQPLPEFAPVE